jgi:ABC-type cobalamin transport system permease subunit
MEPFPFILVFFAIGFGCFYWTNNIVTAVSSLFGVSIVLAGILGVVTQGWGIVVLLFYPYALLAALISGAVAGWIVRRIVRPEAKEKSK